MIDRVCPAPFLASHSFTKRLRVWLKKPLSYRIRSLYLKAKALLYFFFSGAIIRQIFFDTIPSDSLLMCHGPLGTFVVAARDRSIGRRVFVQRRPYDFEKVEAAVALLGGNHRRALLVDIGANIGTICVPAVKKGLFQNAIAIEPEPRNYALLLANISINMLGSRITAHNLALGQKDGESLTLELCKDNHGDHRIRVQNYASKFTELKCDTVEVKSATFNKVIQDVNAASTLIWIDTQGFEGYVLSGASNALSKRTPLCVEFWPYGMARSGSYPLLKEALVSNGYTYFVDLGEPNAQIPLSFDALDNLYDRLSEQGRFTDLVVA